MRRERAASGSAPASTDGLRTPEWARNAVVYCVYPRAFSAQGTFDAVRAGLGAIRELGADALWILPIHPIGELGRKGRLGSPYAIRDYYAIDPALGAADDFRRLVRDAHDRGLRVLIDLVLNHAALDHPEGVAGWFQRDRLGRRTRRVGSWTDVADWNFSSAEVRGHLLGAVEHWVREFDIDGYRCDVAGMVPADFWVSARQTLLRLKPDHLMIAEWDDPAMHESAFHATYDWELYRAMVRASRGILPAPALSQILRRRHSDFPAGARPFRFVENHDEPRSRRRFRNAAVGAAIYTALAGGLFLVYNGQEIGARTRPDLFDGDPIDWKIDGASKARDQMRKLIRLRAGLGSFGPPVPVDAGPSQWVTAYKRAATASGGGPQKIIVALNLSGRHLPLDGGLREQVEAGMALHDISQLPAGAPVSAAGRHLPPRSARVWVG